MKRLGNLYPKLISRNNLALALRKAARKKKKRIVITKTLLNSSYYLDKLQEMLEKEDFHTSTYNEKIVYEPKKRTIYALPFFPDRILHHAILNIVEPYWDSLLDYDAYSCRSGKGTHAGSRRCMQFVRRYPYVLQCDISKFYPSIDHALLKDILRRKIKDMRFLALLDEIIDSANNIRNAVPGKNCPIGNLMSQWFGNLYMGELDKWLRQEKHVRAYMRYCDDFLLFSDDKGELAAIRDELPEFLANRLALRLSKMRLFKTCQGVDTLGYRHFPDYVLVRKRTATRIKRFFRKVNAGAIPEKDLEHARGALASYEGVVKHACTKHFRDSLHIEQAVKILGIDK